MLLPAGPVSLVEYSTVRRAHQMGSKKRKRKSKATASDGGMVIVKGNRKKDLSLEEIKKLPDPIPTSPDGRVKFDPPTFKR